MPTVSRKTPDRNHTQSVLFDRSKWTTTSAKKWLRDHDMFTDGLDKTENKLRFRQFNPNNRKFRYRTRTIDSTRGISLILAFKKSSSVSRAVIENAIKRTLKTGNKNG